MSLFTEAAVLVTVTRSDSNYSIYESVTKGSDYLLYLNVCLHLLCQSTYTSCDCGFVGGKS